MNETETIIPCNAADPLQLGCTCRCHDNGDAALAGYEQTSGDLCAACHWRGRRGRELNGATVCEFCAFTVLAATLVRVRALADRWAADNQTVWAEELQRALGDES